jgi:hypothetical protein
MVYNITMEQEGQRIKEAKLSWFKRHLNWTLVIAWLGGGLVYIALMLFALLNEIIRWPIIIVAVIVAVAINAVTIWVYRQKGRSWRSWLFGIKK